MVQLLIERDSSPFQPLSAHFYSKLPQSSVTLMQGILIYIQYCLRATSFMSYYRVGVESPHSLHHVGECYGNRQNSRGLKCVSASKLDFQHTCPACGSDTVISDTAFICFAIPLGCLPLSRALYKVRPARAFLARKRTWHFCKNCQCQ